MKMPVLNSAASLYRIEVLAPVGGPSLTRQEFAEECDINGIMARYEKQGGWLGNPEPPRYLDLSETPKDLLTAMNIIKDAQASFDALPAGVRKEFDNNAMRFVEYASDPENIERLRGWGLAAPAPAPEPPIKVEVIAPIVPPVVPA